MNNLYGRVEYGIVDPRIRFGKTKEGAAIAFWSLGQGPNLVHLPFLPWGHVQLEWRDPELRLWYERLATFTRLVRYDGRGTGLSDRVAKSYGLEAQVSDIDAVVERLGACRFSASVSWCQAGFGT